VEEEFARRRVRDDGALVADDEIVEPSLLEVGPHRSEHAAGDDDHVDARGPRPAERLAGARPQDTVLGDQRPVEIGREGGDPLRESGRKFDRYGVPPVDFTT
jgi:hypothetical protein